MTQSLATYGIGELGEILGIDYRFQPLFSGVLSSFSSSFISNSKDVVTAIQEGLINGAVTIGVEYATQEIDDPLVAASVMRTATGILKGVLGVSKLNPNFDSSQPASDTNQKYIISNGLVDGIFDSFSESFNHMASLGVTGSDAWSRAQYLQRITDLSEVINAKGLGVALEGLATQIMTEDSINDIVLSFGTVQAYIEDALNGDTSELITIGGVLHKKIMLSNGDYIFYNTVTKDITKYRKGNEVFEGVIVKTSDGTLLLDSGTKAVVDENDNPLMIYKYKDGQIEGVLYKTVTQSGSSDLVEVGMERSNKSDPDTITVTNYSSGKKYTITSDTVISETTSSSMDLMDVMWAQTYFIKSDESDFNDTAREIVGQRAAEVYLSEEIARYGGEYLDIMLGASTDPLGDPYTFLNDGGMTADIDFLTNRSEFDIRLLTDTAYQEVKTAVVDFTKSFLEDASLSTVKNVFQYGLTKLALKSAFNEVAEKTAVSIFTAPIEQGVKDLAGYSTGNFYTKAAGTLAINAKWFGVAVATVASVFTPINAGIYTEAMEIEYDRSLEPVMEKYRESEGLIDLAPNVDSKLEYIFNKQAHKTEALSIIERQIKSVENELLEKPLLDKESRKDLISFRDRLLLDWQAVRMMQ